jgi:hypothetical protein
MEAADESKKRNGSSVSLDEIWARAKKSADKRLNQILENKKPV